MPLSDGSLQNEWAPGHMWAQNGDLEFGEFEPHYVRTLCTHINQSKQKINFSKKTKNKKRHTKIPELVLYILFLSEQTE